MGIVWIVIIDVIIAVIAVISAQGVFLIINFFKFIIPFTNEMISKGIIKQTIKIQLLAVELSSCLLTFIIGNGLCLVGAYFTRPSGFIVYGIVTLIMLLFFRPTKDRYTKSFYNINEYIRQHSICMDMDKFNEINFN
jgi:hypothetical protein